ncbi:MAG: hypothetical protein ACE15E_07625 [Acidobacteriota bacterium]
MKFQVASRPEETRPHAEHEWGVEDLVLTRLMHLDAKLSGFVVGFCAAIGIFVATNWLVLKGGNVVGPHLSLLNQFLYGYRVTFVGSLIGSAYFLVGGFILGYFIARTYNAFVDLRNGKA